MKIYQEVRNGQIVPVSAEIENEEELAFLLEQLRPKGEWYGDGADYTCSVCKHSLLEFANSQDYIEFDRPNFCPNCGANMKGGKK